MNFICCRFVEITPSIKTLDLQMIPFFSPLLLRIYLIEAVFQVHFTEVIKKHECELVAIRTLARTVSN